MSSFNLKVPIKGINGKDIETPIAISVEDFINSLPKDLIAKVVPHYINNEGERTKTYVSDVCISALLHPMDGDKKKMEKYDLYKKINSSKETGEVDLTIDDLSLLKRTLDDTIGQLAMGQVMDVIDPKPNK